jgi:hypothetical protein
MPAASLLPVTIHNGKLYFLFGKENPLEDSSKGFSDFGGGKEDKSFYDTALREAAEEFTGFFGPPEKLRKMIKKNGGTYIHRYKADTPDEYRVHIFYIDYDPFMIDMFNNNHQYLWNRMDKHMLNDSKLFEKIEIKWFCETELLRKKPLYRHFYYNIVKELVDKLDDIRAFIEPKHYKHKSKTCRRCGMLTKPKTRKNRSQKLQKGGK